MAASIKFVGAHRVPHVGRTRELAHLRIAFDEARRGRGRFLLIGGESGVGKTRLCEEAASIAAEAGTTVLGGSCLEGEATLPYLPFVELLEAAARTVPSSSLRQALGESAAQLAAISPHLRTTFQDIPPAPPFLPEHERQYLFAAVRDFLNRLSQGRPLVLVFEDVHWADLPTLLLVRHLIPFVASRPILVIATYRPSEVGIGDPSSQTRTSFGLLVDQVNRARRGDVLELADLSADETEAMVGAILRTPPSAEAAKAVYELTGGNPFFIEQVVKHLAEEHRLGEMTGELVPNTGADFQVPQSVKRVIDRRLDSAGTPCADVLSIASVVGHYFDFEVLSTVWEQDPADLETGLQRATAAHLITGQRVGRSLRYSFRHDLIRQALLEHLSLPRRERLHAAIGQAIEDASTVSGEERDSEIAYHYANAGHAIDAGRALRSLQIAAAKASAATAYEQAADLYELALGYVAPGNLATRCELLLDASDARKRVSDSDAARAGYANAAAIAMKLDNAAFLARAALGFARSWPTISSVDAVAVKLLQDALEAVPHEDLIGRARLSSRLALQLLYSGSPSEVLERAREAVALARSSGDPITLARALQVLHAALWEPHHLDERLCVATETLLLADAIADPAVALWGHRPRIADLSEFARMDEARVEVDTYERIAISVGQPIFVWQAAVRRAMLAIFEGHLEEGERLAHRSLELGQRAEGQNLMAAFGGQLLIIRWQQGRLEELRPLIMQSRTSQPNVKLWSAVLAFIESEAGNTAAARAEFEQLAEGRFASIPNEDTLLVVLVLATLVCAALGDGLRAEELYELLAPYDGRNIVVSEGVACVGATAHYLGVLAATARRWDDAESHFEAAIELNANTGGRPWLARAQFELARMLLARRRPGDRVRSRDLLATALGIARDTGMRGLQDKIEGIQRGHRRLLPDRPDGLTTRELEILTLVASGHSTKEVSERLFLSPRTTARHITNIYAKIGVRNRVGASGYARKHKLLA